MIIGIGIDLVDVDRIKKSVDQFGDFFLQKILTNNEINYCKSQFNCYPYYAICFAAKEALLKAMGTGLRDGISWQDMELTTTKNSASLMCSGKCELNLKKLNTTYISVSTSCTNNFGMAFVILENEKESRP